MCARVLQRKPCSRPGPQPAPAGGLCGKTPRRVRGRRECQTGASMWRTSLRWPSVRVRLEHGAHSRSRQPRQPGGWEWEPWGRAGLRVEASLTQVPCCLCPQLTLLVVQVSILYYGGHLVISGQMTSGNLISFIIYEFVLGDCMEVRGWLAEGGPGEREERVAERDLNGVLQGLREVGRRSKVGRGEIIMTPLASDSSSARGAERQRERYFRKCTRGATRGLGVPIPVSQRWEPRLGDVKRLARHVCGDPGGSDFRLTHLNTRCRGKDQGRFRVCLHQGPPASRS